MVGWDKIVDAKELDVEVWQILIEGKKPKRLPGSRDDKVVVAKRTRHAAGMSSTTSAAPTGRAAASRPGGRDAGKKDEKKTRPR